MNVISLDRFWKTIDEPSIIYEYYINNLHTVDWDEIAQFNGEGKMTEMWIVLESDFGIPLGHVNIEKGSGYQRSKRLGAEHYWEFDRQGNVIKYKYQSKYENEILKTFDELGRMTFYNNGSGAYFYQQHNSSNNIISSYVNISDFFMTKINDDRGIIDFESTSNGYDTFRMSDRIMKGNCGGFVQKATIDDVGDKVQINYGDTLKTYAFDSQKRLIAYEDLDRMPDGDICTYGYNITYAGNEVVAFDLENISTPTPIYDLEDVLVRK